MIITERDDETNPKIHCPQCHSEVEFYSLFEYISGAHHLLTSQIKHAIYILS